MASRSRVKTVTTLTRRFNNIANMEIKGVVNQATALVHGQAEALAPVDEGILAGSIHMQVKETNKGVEGRVYTNLEYAPYVEFGTGIKGNGSYPYKTKGLKYKDSPWFIPVDKIDPGTAEKYHFTKVFGKNGAEYYICYGQEAQPFMYPALKDNQKTIRQMFKNAVKSKVKGTGG